MPKWVLVKVQHEESGENGPVEKINEYLVDAFTLVEAAYTATERLKDELKEILPVQMAFLKVCEVLQGEKVNGEYINYDYWFSAKVKFMNDEGKDKTNLFIITAQNFEGAYARIKKEVETYKVYWEIIEVKANKIIEVFNYYGEIRDKDPNKQLAINFLANNSDPEDEVNKIEDI